MTQSDNERLCPCKVIHIVNAAGKRFVWCTDMKCGLFCSTSDEGVDDEGGHVSERSTGRVESEGEDGV